MKLCWCKGELCPSPCQGPQQPYLSSSTPPSSSSRAFLRRSRFLSPQQLLTAHTPSCWAKLITRLCILGLSSADKKMSSKIENKKWRRRKNVAVTAYWSNGAGDSTVSGNISQQPRAVGFVKPFLMHPSFSARTLGYEVISCHFCCRVKRGAYSYIYAYRLVAMVGPERELRGCEGKIASRGSAVSKSWPWTTDVRTEKQNWWGNGAITERIWLPLWENHSHTQRKTNRSARRCIWRYWF
jgi:hypothetical protein